MSKLPHGQMTTRKESEPSHPVWPSEMNFYDLLDDICRNLIITRHCRRSNLFVAKIDTSEAFGKFGMEIPYGTGKSHDEAVKDYMGRIQGKTLIVNPDDIMRRKEYKVPEHLFIP